jgi:hypothetical protein
MFSTLQDSRLCEHSLFALSKSRTPLLPYLSPRSVTRPQRVSLALTASGRQSSLVGYILKFVHVLVRLPYTTLQTSFAIILPVTATPRLQSLHHSACTTACTTACTSRVNEVSPSRPCRALRSRRSHGRRIHCQGQRGASRQRRYHVNQHLISSLVVQY